MRWEKGPSWGRGRGAGRARGEWSARRASSRRERSKLGGPREQDTADYGSGKGPAEVRKRDLHGGISPCFAPVLRDVLGSTEQFCCRAKEAGGEGAARAGSPCGCEEEQRGRGRGGRFQPHGQRGAAGGEDVEELRSLDLEYASVLENQEVATGAGCPVVCPEVRPFWTVTG